MTEPTLSVLAEKVDDLIGEVHQIKVWLIGNGHPGVLGDIRDLRRDINANMVTSSAAQTAAQAAASLVTATASALERKEGGWRQRLLFDVTRNVATILMIALLGWSVVTFGMGLGLRISAGQ